MSVMSLGLALSKCGYTNNHCSTKWYCNERFLLHMMNSWSYFVKSLWRSDSKEPLCCLLQKFLKLAPFCDCFCLTQKYRRRLGRLVCMYKSRHYNYPLMSQQVTGGHQGCFRGLQSHLDRSKRRTFFLSFFLSYLMVQLIFDWIWRWNLSEEQFVFGTNK